MPTRRIQLAMRGGAEGDQPFRPLQPSVSLPSPGFSSGAAAVAALPAQLLSNWVVLAVVACLVVLVVLLWWLVRGMMRNSYGTQTSIDLVKTPVAADALRTFSVKAFPAEGNGQRLSMSFWLYVSDFNKNNGSFQHVLHVGQQDGTLSSPLVFLDRNTNKLAVWFSKTTGPNPASLAQLLRSGSASIAGDFDLDHHGVLIPYVPQQRWVHVAVVVDETVQATTITAYVDGEAVVQTTSGDRGGAGSKDLRNLNLTLSLGSLYTGGDVSSATGPGFPGYVSRVSFYNYELNASDILALYRKGPYPTGWFGLGAYGLRTPIYKITGA